MLATRVHYSTQHAKLQADNPLFFYFSAMSRYDLSTGRVNASHEQDHIDYVKRKGWKLFTKNDKNKRDYRAVAFINHASQEIVIAHRGTNVGSNYASIANIIADYLIANKKIPKGILKETFNFIEKVYHKAFRHNYSLYTFHQTGFSLGGFLAGIGGGYFEMHYPNVNGLSISIDGPGTLPAINQLIAKGKIADNRNKTIDYIVDPSNIVNSCNARCAAEVRKLKSTANATLDHIDEFYISENLPIDETFALYNSAKTHNLNDLITSIQNANYTLSYISSQEYVTREYTIHRGDKPLQLDKFFANLINEGLDECKGLNSNNLINLFTQMSSQQKLLAGAAMVITGGAAYYYRDTLSDQLGNFCGEKIRTIECYQAVLNTLHKKYNFVGLSMGNAQILRLNPTEYNNERRTANRSSHSNIHRMLGTVPVVPVVQPVNSVSTANASTYNRRAIEMPLTREVEAHTLHTFRRR